MDASYLKLHNRELLDFAYLGPWLSELSLQREWSDVWRQAFPETDSIQSPALESA